MSHSTDTLIVGAGQAGLSVSRHVTRAGLEHAVLEHGLIGERWRSERWDSLTLLTPDWLSRLDGSEPHPDPDAFLGREDFVTYLDRYARSFGAPVHDHVTVTSVTRPGRRFHVETSAGRWRARNVVIATGDSAEPRIPAVAASAPPELAQLHANGYRNPAALPDGGERLDLAVLHELGVTVAGRPPEYSWLHLPVLGEDGEVVHRHGVTPVLGLYVLGLKLQRRRSSHFIGGVGADAAWVAHGIARAGADRPAAAPPRPDSRRHELVRRAWDALSVFRQRPVGVTNRPVARDLSQVLR